MQKRGKHHAYSGELRAKNRPACSENGNKATVGKFSAKLNHAIPESALRNLKQAYLV